MDILSFLILPFLTGLVLTGIHAYLGVHVVERGVIFVDLSLAQIAALGTTVAFLAGYDLHSGVSYFLSLFLAESSDFLDRSDFLELSAFSALSCFWDSSDLDLPSFLEPESPFEELDEEPAEGFLA